MNAVATHSAQFDRYDDADDARRMRQDRDRRASAEAEIRATRERLDGLARLAGLDDTLAVLTADDADPAPHLPCGGRRRPAGDA